MIQKNLIENRTNFSLGHIHICCFCFKRKKICFDFRQTSLLKQESFYLDNQNNAKVSIIKTDSTNTSSTGNKSVRKYSPGNLLLIPTNEEIETSQVTKNAF